MSKIKEVIDAGLISHERIFPILNKFDRIFNYHSDKSMCEIMGILITEYGKKWTGKSIPDDLELTKLMDEYIEKYNIK